MPDTKLTVADWMTRNPITIEDGRVDRWRRSTSCARRTSGASR